MTKKESMLEQRFKSAAEVAQKRIKEKLVEASKALSEAEDISNQLGIPFYSHISPLSQGFQPRSFSDKWKGVDENLLWEVCNTGLLEYDGWQHSAVC